MLNQLLGPSPDGRPDWLVIDRKGAGERHFVGWRLRVQANLILDLGLRAAEPFALLGGPFFKSLHASFAVDQDGRLYGELGLVVVWNEYSRRVEDSPDEVGRGH